MTRERGCLYKQAVHQRMRKLAGLERSFARLVSRGVTPSTAGGIIERVIVALGA